MTVKSSTLLIVAACIAFAFLSAFMVFRLPFFFPTSHLTMSESYAAGFNNKVAAISIMLLSVAATLFHGIFVPAGSLPPIQGIKISTRFGWIACSVVVAYQGLLAVLVSIMGMHWGESTYFLEKLPMLLHFHMRMYRDFEFAYGPLLLYVPYWLDLLFGKLDGGRDLGYYVAFLAMHVAGLWLVFYILNQINIPGRCRHFVFLVLTLVVLLPSNLGVNYTYLRFCLFIALLIYLGRQQTIVRMFLVAYLGALLQMAISPEMVLACFGGCLVYCAVAVRRQRNWAWALPCIAPPLAVLTVIAIVGKEYLESIATFSFGYLNMIARPTGYMMLFLLLVLGLVPVAVGRSFASGEKDATLIAAVYVGGLLMVPAALGLCEGPHLLFNSVAFCFLGAFAARWLSPWMRYAAALAVLWVVTFPAAASFLQHRAFIGPILRMDISQHMSNDGKARLAAVMDRVPRARGFVPSLYSGVPQAVDPDLVRRLVGNGRVAAPAGFERETGDRLRSMGILQPGYYYSFYNMADSKAETRVIREMNAAKVVMVPSAPFFWDAPVPSPMRFLGYRVGEWFDYRTIRPSYRPGVEIAAELARNWKVVGSSGGFLFYRRTNDLAASNAAFSAAAGSSGRGPGRRSAWSAE